MKVLSLEAHIYCTKLILNKIYFIIKCPARDACLYTGKIPMQGVPVRTFYNPLGRFSSNLAHVCSCPGK